MLNRSQNFRIYFALCIVALLPFVALSYPPIVDFPNHAARLFVECHLESFSTMREIHFGIIPNLAIDLIGAPLCGMISPERIVTWTIALSYLGICLLIWAIRKRLHGDNDALVLILPALAMNLVTSMGYVNFLVGIAVVFLLILVIVTRPDIGWGPLFLLCTVLGTGIFFAHIFALLFVLVLIAGWVWENRFGAYRPIVGLILSGLVTAVLFSVPLVLVLLSGKSGTGGANIAYLDEIRALIAPLFGFDARDEKLLAVLALGALFGLARNHAASVAPEFKRSLWLLLAACVVLPCTAIDAIDVNVRLVVPLVLLAVASCRFKSSERAGYIVMALAAAAFVVHAGTAWFIWRPFSDQVAEMREATGVLPANAPVLTVMAEAGPEMRMGSDMPYWHLASYAEIDRHIFNPIAFTGKGMQPLSTTARYRSFASPASDHLTVRIAQDLAEVKSDKALSIIRRNYHLAYAVNWRTRFSYIIYYHFGENPNFDPKNLRIINKGSFFSILSPRKVPPDILG